MYIGFDPYHLLFVFIPMAVLMGLAQLWVKGAYAKYSHIATRQGVTGAEAAQVILRAAGIHDVRVEQVDGFLSDHYSPTDKVLRLSPRNYSGNSIAAVGIAAHEAGHAIQHAKRYAPLVVRNIAVPLANIGSTFGWIALMIGLMISGGNPGHPLVLLGIGGIAAIAVFQIINLPGEFDASRRALQVLPEIGILTAEENRGARAVLTAAAMTYVAATIAAIVELLYWLWRLGLIGGNSREERPSRRPPGATRPLPKGGVVQDRVTPCRPSPRGNRILGAPASLPARARVKATDRDRVPSCEFFGLS